MLLIYWTRTSIIQAQTGSIWVVLLVRLCYLLSQADSCTHELQKEFLDFEMEGLQYMG